MKKTSSVSLSEELGKEVKESIYKVDDITQDFLVNLTTHSDNPTIPFFKKTSLSIITRVPTTRFDQYLTGKEVMPLWKKLRIVDLLNLLVAKPRSEQEEFIKWVVKTVIEKRKTKSPDLITPKQNDEYLVQIYVRALQEFSTFEVIEPRLYFPSKGARMSPDFIVHDKDSKTVKIVVFIINDKPLDQLRKLDKLAYHLNYFSKKKLSEFEGAEIKGVIICSNPSKQLKSSALEIGVTIILHTGRVI